MPASTTDASILDSLAHVATIITPVLLALIAIGSLRWYRVHTRLTNALERFDDSASQAGLILSGQLLHSVANREKHYRKHFVLAMWAEIRERSESTRQEWIDSIKSQVTGGYSGTHPSSATDPSPAKLHVSPRPRNPACAELLELSVDLAQRKRLWKRIGPASLGFSDLRDARPEVLEKLFSDAVSVDLSQADLRVAPALLPDVLDLLSRFRSKLHLSGAWLPSMSVVIGNGKYRDLFTEDDDSPGLFLGGNHRAESSKIDDLSGLRIAGGPGVILQNRNLRGIRCQHATLIGADFSHADITGAKFTQADITCSDFTSTEGLADFTGASEFGVPR